VDAAAGLRAGRAGRAERATAGGPAHPNTVHLVAATDVTNIPMAAAFARAGYPVDQERIFLV
jgi:hypothetical protein